MSFVSRRRFLTLSSGTAAVLLASACSPAAAPNQTAASAPAAKPTEASKPGPAEQGSSVEAPEPAEAPRPTAPSTGAPPQAGTLTLVPPQIVQTLDPNIGVTDITRMHTDHMFDRVIELTADGHLKPMLAESWRAVDPRTWELKLRQGVKFHDGTPFTSEVLKFTIERILDKKYNSLQATYWAPVTSITTPDDSTLAIKTEKPMGVMPYTLALTTPVLPSVGTDPTAFPATPIGTGPFKFVEWRKDDRVVMEANPDYWGGLPSLKQVIIRSIPELSTRMSALERGEVDVVLEIVPEDVKRLRGRPGLEILNVETFRTSWIWMNGKRNPFTDVKVRQAMQHAINMDEIVDSVIAGIGVKARAPIAPKVFGFNPSLPPYEYNPQKAKDLLKEAGLPNGFECGISGMGARGGYARTGDVAEVIIAQLEAVGIKATPVVEDPATANKNLLELNWDMVFAGATAVTGDADNGMARLYVSSANRNGWGSEELDKLLLLGRESTDQQVRLKAYQDAQVILWREGPSYWTYHSLDTVGVRKRVKGFSGRPDRMLDARNVSVEG
jgi:peptide/nickel transport system substrate-binding protein